MQVSTLDGIKETNHAESTRVRTLTAKTSPGGVWIFEDWHKFIQFQLQTEGIAVEAG